MTNITLIKAYDVLINQPEAVKKDPELQDKFPATVIEITKALLASEKTLSAKEIELREHVGCIGVKELSKRFPNLVNIASADLSGQWERGCSVEH